MDVRLVGRSAGPVGKAPPGTLLEDMGLRIGAIQVKVHRNFVAATRLVADRIFGVEPEPSERRRRRTCQQYGRKPYL